jgi:hypothetical protein
VLTEIELAPAQRRLLLTWEFGSLVARFDLSAVDRPGPGARSALRRVAARPREREPDALAGRRGSGRQQAHRRLPQSRQRRQRVWRSRRRTVEGIEMRTFWRISGPRTTARAGFWWPPLRPTGPERGARRRPCLRLQGQGPGMFPGRSAALTNKQRSRVGSGESTTLLVPDQSRQRRTLAARPLCAVASATSAAAGTPPRKRSPRQRRGRTWPGPGMSPKRWRHSRDA